MFLCQRLIGASADKYSCIYTILSVHCNLHYSPYNSHTSAPSMSSALRPDGEAPHHEQPLIMSSISGGFENSHTKTCVDSHVQYTHKANGWTHAWMAPVQLETTTPFWIQGALRANSWGVQDRKHLISRSLSSTNLASLPPTPLWAK